MMATGRLGAACRGQSGLQAPTFVNLDRAPILVLTPFHSLLAWPTPPHTVADAAAIYGNQDEVGQGIKDAGVAREKLWITSKVCRPPYDLSSRLAEQHTDVRGASPVNSSGTACTRRRTSSRRWTKPSKSWISSTSTCTSCSKLLCARSVRRKSIADPHRRTVGLSPSARVKDRTAKDPPSTGL